MDERAFLEEIARRVNEFFRDFPVEADQLFGNPRAFGNEVAVMLKALAGRNLEVPFGIVFASLLSKSTADAGFHLAMVHDDDDTLIGFKVVEIETMTRDEVITKARARFRDDDDDGTPPLLN